LFNFILFSCEPRRGTPEYLSWSRIGTANEFAEGKTGIEYSAKLMKVENIMKEINDELCVVQHQTMKPQP
jgi:hypothetical protein